MQITLYSLFIFRGIFQSGVLVFGFGFVVLRFITERLKEKGL